MSACSAYMIGAGALFTEGLYRRRLAPDRPDRHYLRVGRISGFAITMLGVLYAVFLINRVLYTFLLTETLATFVGISVLGGVVWRRANRWGALASLLGALATNFLLYSLTGRRLDDWDANVFLAALIVGIVALVAVSLLTDPEPAERLASFFDRLETPSDATGAGDRPLIVGIVALVAVSLLTDPEPAERLASFFDRLETPSDATGGGDRPLLLVNVLRLRRAAAGRGWRTFREDLGGLAVGGLLVIALVAATALWLKG